VVVALELQEPKGFGRVRLHHIPDASEKSLVGFVCREVEAAASVRTDGWRGYNALSRHGFQHERLNLSAVDTAAHVSMPGVHRIASLLKRWLLGTHQGSVNGQHLQSYLDEFTFRFNRRHSRRRGLLFYRLLQQIVRMPPAPYKDIIAKPWHNTL